jgi:hypothetical protein
VETPSELKAQAETVRQSADVVRSSASLLDAMSPPLEIKTSHDQLVQGLRDLADGLDHLAESAEAADYPKLDALAEQLLSGRLPGFQEVQDALAKIRAKGYRIEPTPQRF